MIFDEQNSALLRKKATDYVVFAEPRGHVALQTAASFFVAYPAPLKPDMCSTFAECEDFGNPL